MHKHADRIIAAARDPSASGRSAIYASWARSLTRYGLDPQDTSPPRRLTGHELREARERVEPLLFAAGFFELSFSSMAQSLVQLNALPEMRGRVIGLFNMSALGLRFFSGITVGLAGTLVGVHVSLAASAAAFGAVALWLMTRRSR